jgi:tetratricopeptide (TPR) repeat protein
MQPNKERTMKMYGIKGIGIAMLLMLTLSLAFSAQDPSVLLEKAIYTEETLGKLDDAIAIYKQIVNGADTNRNIGALALYRLGMCYRKQGRETDATSTFSTLAKLYPEQRDLLAKSLFSNMKPAPWVDGEVLRLTQKRIGTAYTGGGAFGTFSVESGQEDGKPVWYLRYLFGPTRSPQYYSVTVADAATLLPIKSRIRSNQTDLESRYTVGKIEVLNLKDSSQSPRQIQLEGTAYEMWQTIPILRRLPLQEGFHATIPLFEEITGSLANFQFSVAARETITVPAGSFDCYKVIMDTGENLPNEETFWITADNHAYIARAHVDRINEYELQSVEIVGKNQLASFEIPEFGIGLSAPRQWYLSLSSNLSTFSSSGTAVGAGGMIVIAAPDLDSILNVTILTTDPGSTPTTKMPGTFTTVTKINGIQPRYQVLSETRESVALAGLTGERFIAETQDITSGENIVEYTYSLSSPTKRYTFRFQTGKDSFDKMRPAFESIMASLRVQ